MSERWKRVEQQMLADGSDPDRVKVVIEEMRWASDKLWNLAATFPDDVPCILAWDGASETRIEIVMEDGSAQDISLEKLNPLLARIIQQMCPRSFIIALPLSHGGQLYVWQGDGGKSTTSVMRINGGDSVRGGQRCRRLQTNPLGRFVKEGQENDVTINRRTEDILF
jgi:hypothetical protein